MKYHIDLTKKTNVEVFSLIERDKKQRIFEHLFSIYTNMFFNIKDPLSGLKAINLENSNK